MEKRFWKHLGVFLGGFFLAVLLLFWIVRDDWQRTAVTTEPVNRDTVLSDLVDREVTQEIKAAADRLEALEVYAALSPEGEGNVTLALERAGTEIASRTFTRADIPEDGTLRLPLTGTKTKKGEPLTLRITAGEGIGLWAGSTRSAGKFTVETETAEGLTIGGEAVSGTLVLCQRGEDDLPYMKWYWSCAAALGLICAGVILFAHRCRVIGKPMILNQFTDVCRQYSYLLKTLVIRDFRVKYKASVLGVLWSFLNPLLMTFVYLFVFSTIFRNSIEHFAVYLMSGIVLYNYVSESTTLGMQSVVGNAGLITKVYIPKYVFPISKAISSAINLAISLIPLLIMMAITGVPFSKSLLLLPLLLVLVMMFCIGVSLILSAAMVYFRDVQFLWGIFLTVWNFLSPIFYPESIIPARFATLYHLNPLYQYLFFMRSITVGGISPTPLTYLYCGLASGTALIIGLLFFRKTQSQFVLHL